MRKTDLNEVRDELEAILASGERGQWSPQMSEHYGELLSREILLLRVAGPAFAP